MLERFRSRISSMVKKKNPHAVALGRLGGLKGGAARTASLSAEERSAIARHAANVRWATREDTPALKRQIKEGYQSYLKGDVRPIEEFMAEVEKEIKESGKDRDQETGNRTRRKRR